MVAGQAGLGKSTLLATLFDPFVAPAVVKGTEEARTRIFAPTAAITTFTFEMEPEPGTNLIVEAIDTPGYGDEVSAVEQYALPATRGPRATHAHPRADRVRLHLEGTFGDVFEEEQRIHRNPKFEEHRVHALLYLLEPTSLGLKLFDVDFMKRLDERVNIIPVLAKADGLPREEREAVKRLVMGDIAKHGIRIFDFSPCAALDHEGGGEVNINALLPFAAIGSTFPHAGGDAPRRGRQYATGFVSVDDAKSCDTALLLKILLTYEACTHPGGHALLTHLHPLYSSEGVDRRGTSSRRRPRTLSTRPTERTASLRRRRGRRAAPPTPSPPGAHDGGAIAHTSRCRRPSSNANNKRRR